ncbi:MAG: hypothetical protein KDD94_12535 [Calditrichaeota bacterium]|nr:hypothetical protein [Calditrichota bacterium]
MDNLINEINEMRMKKNNPEYLYVGRQQAQALKRLLKVDYLDCGTIYGLRVIRVKLDFHLNVV